MGKYKIKHYKAEEKCEMIDEYLELKRKEIAETQSILESIKETTTSNGSNESAPAVQVTKTNKQYLKDSLPSVVDFAVHCGVSKQTIYAWDAKGKEDNAPEEDQYFSFKLDSLRTLGEKTIIDAKNKGYIDPVFAKFLLSALYGYQERSQNDITSNGNPIPLLGGASNDSSNNSN